MTPMRSTAISNSSASGSRAPTSGGRSRTSARNLTSASEPWPPKRPRRRTTSRERGWRPRRRSRAPGAAPTPRRGRPIRRSPRPRQEAAAIRADAERQRTEMLEQARAEAAAAEVIRAAEERAAAIVGQRERGGRADPRRSAQCSRARADHRRAASASNVWPRSVPRRPDSRNACERKPTRSCASTPNADAVRPIGSHGPPAASAKLRRRRPFHPWPGRLNRVHFGTKGHHSRGPGTAMARRLRSPRLRGAAVLDAPPRL